MTQITLTKNLFCTSYMSHINSHLELFYEGLEKKPQVFMADCISIHQISAPAFPNPLDPMWSYIFFYPRNGSRNAV